MSKYKLKVSLEEIKFEQWREIFYVLREYDEYGYVIMTNEETSFAEWFEDNLMHLAYLVSRSPNYSVNDKWVLYDRNNNLILSGSDKLILGVLSTHMKRAVELYLQYLENGDIEVARILEMVFGEEHE